MKSGEHTRLACAASVPASGRTNRAAAVRKRRGTLPHGRGSALARVLAQTPHHHRSIALAGDDDRLIHACRWLNRIGGQAQLIAQNSGLGTRNSELAVAMPLLRHSLSNLAALCLLWATPGERSLDRGLRDIARERSRQKELFHAGRISFLCESPVVDPRRKFRVLAEEFGEVAEALDQIENHGQARGNLHTELLQIAAVCVAWLESFQGEAKTQKLKNGK